MAFGFGFFLGFCIAIGISAYISNRHQKVREIRAKHVRSGRTVRKC